MSVAVTPALVAPLTLIFTLWAAAAWMLCGLDLNVQDARATLCSLRGRIPGIDAVHAASERLYGGGTGESETSLGDVSEMVDIVRLGLLAGLSFDASLALYCENGHGLLAREMDRARMSWQLGLCSRETALRHAAARVGVRQLESFAAAVDQAYVLGAPLADTLAQQAAEMRSAHRAEVERTIERAPVKLLIPTGTLILPALLLSILGPLLAGGGML